MSRSLVVEADGGSRGNPGVAGYGALVRDAHTGAVLAERAEPLGRASNNVAEYSGLIAGLAAAHQIDPGADVEVRMDSKLVVEQMSGRWKIKHDAMRRLATQSRAAADAFAAAGGSVRYRWVPRAQNAAADALSNRAMDGHSITGSEEPQAQAQAEEPAEEPAGTAEARDKLISAPAPLPRRQIGPDLADATRIVLVRHGVTDLTVSGRLDGRGGIDPDLNAEGQRQARAAAEGVRSFLGDTSTRLVTSALARGRQTGQLIGAALQLPCRVDDDWDEQSYGDWDGASLADLVATAGEDTRRLREDPTYARPGGETHEDLANRVVPALQREAGAGGTVVVATHRTPIMVVLADLLGIRYPRGWRVAIAPASLTSVRIFRDGGAVVEFVNDMAHLR